VRVVILAAAGNTFSSGHDIGTPEEKEDMRRRPFPKGVRGEYALSHYLFLDTTLRWRDLDKPTIAQAQGMCIFGGWMFAGRLGWGLRLLRLVGHARERLTAPRFLRNESAMDSL
jgi:hypothetical protein